MGPTLRPDNLICQEVPGGASSSRGPASRAARGQQVALLGQAGGRRGPPPGSRRARRPGRRPSRAGGPARPRAGGGRPSRSSASSVASRSRPARGPSTMATATAWLSVTIGLGATRSSRSYRARICGQSVSSAAGRLVVHRGDGRLQLVRAEPVGATPACALIRATPSAIAARSHRLRSCSASGTSAAVGAGAGRPAGVGEQHEGQQPRHLAVVRAAARCTARVRRIASAVRSRRCRSGPDVAT